FDAVDGKPVDLLFAVTVPEQCNEDHLKLLAQVAELFSDPDLLKKLRQAENSGTLLQLLSSTEH
ncbi:MAG: PTS sugar transporter subunit IIA, partial [Xanthomonadales bacterium]|nr:PTS sugar transporter subunit IIA [Xanthomonadales bacterium]